MTQPTPNQPRPDQPTPNQPASDQRPSDQSTAGRAAVSAPADVPAIRFAGAAVGFSGATTFEIGLVAAAGIFLYVRIYGEDDPNRP